MTMYNIQYVRMHYMYICMNEHMYLCVVCISHMYELHVLYLHSTGLLACEVCVHACVRACVSVCVCVCE